MNLDDIPEKSKQLMNQVTNAVETTGKKVANKVSTITENKTEEVTEEAIQTAVNQAIDILEVASKKVKEKDINSEKVTIEVGIGIVNVAHLKITTDVQGKDEVNIELTN